MKYCFSKRVCSYDYGNKKSTKEVYLLILILWMVAVAPVTHGVPQDSQNLNNTAWHSELLRTLNEAPQKLNLSGEEFLAGLEELKVEAERDFSSESVMEAAKLFQENLDKVGSYQKGIESLSELKNTFSDILSDNQTFRLTIFIAEFNYRKKEYGEMLNRLEPILPKIEDPFLRGGALASLGLAYNGLGRYHVAAGQYFEAIDEFRKAERKDRVAEIYNRLGSLYYFIQQYETSIAYYNQHLKTAEELEDEKMLGNGYVNIGAAHRAAGNTDEALAYYKKGIELAERTGNILDLARVNMNIANLYAEQKQFEDALQYYSVSLAVSEEYGLEYGVLINQFNIGNTMFDMGRFDESEEAYLIAFSMMNEENHKFEMLHLTDRLSKLYENRGDYEKALSYLILYTELNSEIFDSEKLRLAEELRIEYETELREQELVLAETVLKKQIAQNRFLGLFAISLIIILIAATAYNIKRNEYLQALYNRNLENVKTLGIQLDVKSTESNGENGEEPHIRNKLYLKIKALLTEEKIYRDPDVSLPKVAEIVGSNRRYVSDAISDATGMNFRNYVNFYRINEAKKLIDEGEDSMSEVQYSCGFNSRATFYTAFKKFTGMTPSEFSKISRTKKQQNS